MGANATFVDRSDENKGTTTIKLNKKNQYQEIMHKDVISISGRQFRVEYPQKELKTVRNKLIQFAKYFPPIIDCSCIFETVNSEPKSAFKRKYCSEFQNQHKCNKAQPANTNASSH